MNVHNINIVIYDLGTNATLEAISIDMLIPPHDTLEKYFRYQGSLTTPDCSEAVVWTVFEQAIPLSKEQVTYGLFNIR